MGEEGKVPAADGAGEEPDTSGCELSGDWGALDSFAMDPGTFGCIWIAWPEAGRRRKFHSPENTAKMLAKVGTNCTKQTTNGNRPRELAAKRVAHRVSNIRSEWRQCASAHSGN
jgi:hypothetical protein